MKTLEITHSPQSAFNKVWNHFIRDNNPIAKDELGKCVYRNLEGHACALGIFIPDLFYRPDMEEKNINMLIDEGFIEFKFTATRKLIQSLQHAHDYCSGKDGLKARLTQIADKYELDIPKVEKPVFLSVTLGEVVLAVRSGNDALAERVERDYDRQLDAVRGRRDKLNTKIELLTEERNIEQKTIIMLMEARNKTKALIERAQKIANSNTQNDD